MEETKPKEKRQRRILYSRAEVTELLKKQRERCALSINGNMTQYTARRVVKDTPLLDF